VRSPIVDSAQGRMALSDIMLGDVRLRLVAEGGTASTAQPQTGDPKARAPKGREATSIAIEEATIEGPELLVAIAPRSNVAFVQGGGIKDAALNVHLGLKIEDALIDKDAPDPKAADKTTKPNVALRYMMQANPIKGHLVDGAFGVAITGTIGDVKVRTERPRARVGSAATGTSRKLNIDHPEGEGEGEGEDKPKAKATEGDAKPTTAEPRRPTTVARPRPTQPSMPSTLSTPSPRPRPVIPSEPVPGDEPAEHETAPTPSAPPTPEPPPAIDPPMDPGVAPGEGGEVPHEEPLPP